jgi:hypothetical protein
LLKNGIMNYIGIKDLKVEKFLFQLALDIFKLTKSFPKEEKYMPADSLKIFNCIFSYSLRPDINNLIK